MPDQWVYLNGQILPFSQAALPLHDAGFVLGATVVDNCRTFHQKLFLWPEHLARFRRDCAWCGIPVEATDEELTAAAESVVARTAAGQPAGREFQVTTFATPGPIGFYRGLGVNGPPTLGLLAYPLPTDRYRQFFLQGATLAVAGRQSWHPEDLLPPAVKHRSRLFWHLAERRIRDPQSPRHHPSAVPVVLNQEGYGETAIGSILVVIDNTVIAPSRDWGLDSISVQFVERLCRQVGLGFERAAIDLRPLATGWRVDLSGTPRTPSELLLTGTGFCLAGVREWIDGPLRREFPWPGSACQRLIDAWSLAVQADIRQASPPSEEG